MGKGSGSSSCERPALALPKYYKYPRTPHLPWSEGRSSDDVGLADCRQFLGKEVVVTAKMDGENTSLYRDHYHARSLDSKYHPSRTYVKQLHGQIRHEIPEGWRVCGENLYAKHSIEYDELPDYFLVFSIWDENNRSLSWKETQEWTDLLGLHSVPQLYQGEWNEEKVKQCYPRPVYGQEAEGYVVRTQDGFEYQEFPQRMAKFVRKNHVQTDQHWMSADVVPNQLQTTS